MIRDEVRQRVVLFGGVSSLADTWERDGSQLLQGTPVTSPPAADGLAMVWDEVRQRVVLFVGDHSGTWFLMP